MESQTKGPGSLVFDRIAYEFDYFSGSQISIYIGDLLIDDVESIQFTVTQTKRPVYGYASQYFHTMADGQVLVEGAFSIPFKEADYILAALTRYQEGQAPIGLPGGEVPLVDLEGNKVYPRGGFVVNRENIERRMEESNKKNLPDWQMYNQLAALSDENFEDVAEIFEDLLWKEYDQDFLTNNIPPGLGSSAPTVSGTHRRADQYPLFDIWILYGDLTNAAANHTIKKLIGVSIIGQGQAIVVGGEPVREQYRFIARNLG